MREWYKRLSEVFNGGKPLEYKYTRKDGWWTMTKGFQHTPGIEINAKQWLDIRDAIKSYERMHEEVQKELRGRGRPKKVHTKFK